MIIAGYPGCGKTTLSKKYEDFKDLDSSWFNDGSENWYEDYINLASFYSDCGFKVFVSTHSCVLNELKNRNIPVILWYPDEALAEEWIEHLNKRFMINPSCENFNSYSRIKEFYLADVNSLDNFDSKYKVKITTLNNFEAIENDLTNFLINLEAEYELRSTKYEFIYGIAKNKKEATLWTDNIFDIVREIETNKYYMQLDLPEFKSQEDKVTYLKMILESASSWYFFNDMNEVKIGYDFDYDEEICLYEGRTIKELLIKLAFYIKMHTNEFHIYA